MFGIRTIVLGLDLLTLTGAAQDRARAQAVAVHATDTACAALGGLRGDLRPGRPHDRYHLRGQHGAGRGRAQSLAAGGQGWLVTRLLEAFAL